MTRRRQSSALALLAAVLLGGCVYYNGMYNTNRLARSARKAERDGRAFEASNLWGQVITRAESLVVRHPRSKYADEANVLRGLALARLDQCPDAVGPLGRLNNSGQTGDLAEEATLALGRCQLELGDAAMADIAFVRILDSRDPARRREARFRHARALRMAGRYEEALTVLREAPDPRAGEDLLLALAATGQTGEALALTDSLLALNDTTFVWDSVVATMGRRDPRAASELTDRLRKDPKVTPELMARRLYDDALRLAGVDTVRAAARLAEAATSGATESGALARVRLLRHALAAARTIEELAPIADSLKALAERPTAAASEAEALEGTVVRVRMLPDSAGPGVPQGDLRLFLGAELARDTLGAPALAAGLFRRLAEDWPASPYAPKALLAAGRLDESGASLAVLDSLYADSPYLAITRGEEAPGYRVLEDSLEAFAATQAVVRTRQPPRAQPGIRRPSLKEMEPDAAPRRTPAEKDTPRTRPGVEP